MAQAGQDAVNPADGAQKMHSPLHVGGDLVLWDQFAQLFLNSDTALAQLNLKFATDLIHLSFC